MSTYGGGQYISAAIDINSNGSYSTPADGYALISIYLAAGTFTMDGNTFSSGTGSFHLTMGPGQTLHLSNDSGNEARGAEFRNNP